MENKQGSKISRWTGAMLSSIIFACFGAICISVTIKIITWMLG